MRNGQALIHVAARREGSEGRLNEISMWHFLVRSEALMFQNRQQRQRSYPPGPIANTRADETCPIFVVCFLFECVTIRRNDARNASAERRVWGRCSLSFDFTHSGDCLLYRGWIYHQETLAIPRRIADHGLLQFGFLCLPPG